MMDFGWEPSLGTVLRCISFFSKLRITLKVEILSKMYICTIYHTMYLRYSKHIHLAASCSNHEYIALALRNDLCLKTSVACFFFLLRLLSLPSESWPTVKVKSHWPTCLSVLGNCTNRLVEAQPDCLPSWPLYPLRHPQDVHRGPWQHIYFFSKSRNLLPTSTPFWSQCQDSQRQLSLLKLTFQHLSWKISFETKSC